MEKRGMVVEEKGKELFEECAFVCRDTGFPALGASGRHGDNVEKENPDGD